MPPSTLETLTSRPTRAAILATYVGFSAYVTLFSPGAFDTWSPTNSDNQLLTAALADPTSLNPIFFCIFNALGVIPAINLALLLPGSKDQSPLPTVPFAAGSFALGFGAIGPYLALRQPRTAPIQASQLGFFSRYVTESKLYGVGMAAASLALAGGLAGMPDFGAAASEYAELFATSKLVHVSSIDFCILAAFAFDPIREDMGRRGWWDEGSSDNNLGRLLAFSAVPLLGPAAYLVLRPSLRDD